MKFHSKLIPLIAAPSVATPKPFALPPALTSAKEYVRATNRTLLVLEAGAQPRLPQAPTGGAQ